MTMRSGVLEKSVPPRLVMACARRLRGKPSGSQVINGSLDTASAAETVLLPPPKLPLARPYALCSLKAAWPAAVIGGAGSGLLLVPGPTQAPDISRFGAGPGG